MDAGPIACLAISLFAGLAASVDLGRFSMLFLTAQSPFARCVCQRVPVYIYIYIYIIRHFVNVYLSFLCIRRPRLDGHSEAWSSQLPPKTALASPDTSKKCFRLPPSAPPPDHPCLLRHLHMRSMSWLPAWKAFLILLPLAASISLPHRKTPLSIGVAR